MPYPVCILAATEEPTGQVDSPEVAAEYSLNCDTSLGVNPLAIFHYDLVSIWACRCRSSLCTWSRGGSALRCGHHGPVLHVIQFRLHAGFESFGVHLPSIR